MRCEWKWVTWSRVRLARLWILGLLALVTSATAVAQNTTMETNGRGISAGSTTGLGACAIFPPDNVWNTPVDALPVDPRSDDYIRSIGPAGGLHEDFGSGLYMGQPIGIPYATVSGDQPRVNITFQYSDESDPGPYPIPPNAPVEGGSDAHILLIDRDQCVLYEVFAARRQPDGTWRAGSGAVFDLQSHGLRPTTWTSADAAGLPIFPGLVRYDEVAAGEIRHALRFTVQRTRRAFLWPARHYASSNTDPSVPPMGQRFRLKADYDISGFSPEAQVILTALKKYGMILADNGSNWFISGVPDERWDNDHIREIRRVLGASFEAVDESALQVAAHSGRAKQ